ncbi:uncharacterized protein LOC143632766 isoform X2 [Bidens hawaiensis]|uniref:uncharacterized protein LOC143632766 isoform X2 n=1 Tax=Bidens hawaiensis TaxID=980011 RepID=UPI0040499395
MENVDSFLYNNPLGSISFDPNVHGLPPKDNQRLVKEYESKLDKFINSKWVPEMHRQNLDNDDLVNGSNHATMKSEDIVEPEHAEPLMGRVLDGHKGGTEEVEPFEGHIRHLSEDVVVETFPLRPVSSMVYDVDVKPSEKELLDGDLEVEANIISNAAVDTVENNALSSKHLDSNNSSSSLQHATFEETTADKYKLEMQPGDTVQKQTADATSNEINM